MLNRIFRAMLAAALLSAPLTAEDANDHFHWRPAAAETKPRPWAILLPGASGLDILGDGGHYFRFADWLNTRGIDVLVVDYRNATRFLPETQKGKPGTRIAKIVDHAVAVERAEGRMDLRCEGVVIGWSLGGEGMWELAARDHMAMPGLTRAIGFYPSVRGQPKSYTPNIPVIAFQGTDDRVTKAKNLEAFVAGIARASNISVTFYPEVRHGFDVQSLTSPALGDKLLYDPNADASSKAALDASIGQGQLGCALD